VPGYGAPGPYGAPPAGPGGIQIVDPHGVGQAVNRMSSGAKRSGKIAFAVLASVLEEGDVVEIVVQGRLHGVPGAAALVGSKLVLVNERQWKPDVVVITIGNALQVQGWQDDRTASVLLTVGGQQEVVERIPDRLLAVEFAQRIRERIGQLAAQQAQAQAEPPSA
jgi:hypothetical protein